MEAIHAKHFTHRDIKPDNFVIGLGKKADLIYLIDFGLAKRYRDPDTKVHIAFKTGKSLVGTARYASLNSHLGHELGRRDDLESIFYVILYFLKGSLPWQGLQGGGKKDGYRAIKEAKETLTLEHICEGQPGTPHKCSLEIAEILDILKYSKELKFDEEPDYKWIKQKIGDAFKKGGFQNDFICDWTLRGSIPPKKDFLKKISDERMESEEKIQTYNAANGKL